MQKIKVTGMSCGHCEMAVKEALSNVEGVTKVVEVNKDLNLAIVEGDSDTNDLVTAIKAKGFEAEVLQ